MRLLFCFAIIVLGLSFDGAAQQNQWLPFRISEFQFSMGTEVSNTSPILRPGELSKFASGSQLIDFDRADYSRVGWIPTWSSSLLTLQVGLHPFDKGSGEMKKNRTLRLGLTSQGFNTSIYDSQTDIRYRIDTLLSSSNSSLFGYVDSVYHHNVNADYSATAIKLDGSFVWSTDPDRRFSLYGGIGLNAGIVVATRTEVYSDAWSSEEILDERGYQIASRDDISGDGRMRQERFRNKSGWSATFYAPLGVDLRLAKTKPVWNQLHLFTEMRPCLTLLGIPETKTYAVPGIQNTAGFKLHW